MGFAKTDVIKNYNENNFVNIEYRPFDLRWTFFTGNSRGFHCMPRGKIMRQLLVSNIALIVLRQVKAGDSFQHYFVAKKIVESTLISNKTSEINYAFPLYLYSTDGSKIPNLNKEIVKEIEKTTGKTEPEEILDYIYAVLHSPSYREKYKEFLKIDFPRVPYPKDKTTFRKLVKLGTELRGIHLMESPVVNRFITTFPKDGTCEVEKVVYQKEEKSASGEVWINSGQYFGKVPETAWNFYIGGYQPAQKWLKDRKGRTLTNEDIEHYQKIIVALMETSRLMKEIDSIKIV